MTDNPLRDRLIDAATPFLANFSDEETARINAGEIVDAVLAVLPVPVPPTTHAGDRAALLWAADFAEEVAERLRKHHEFERGNGALDVMTELRRMADEAQQQCPAREPLAGVQCSKQAGHEGAHSDRPGRIWYPAPDAEAQQQGAGFTNPQTGIGYATGGNWSAQQQPATETHSCPNCEGIDPDTCFMNPTRPPEQCPAAEFEDYGQQCQKPVGHELHTFEEQPASGPGRAADEKPAETRPGCNSGPGWYEVINPRNATTNIALVHEDGSLYLPEGEDALTAEEFALAAARGNAHRLVRADEAQQGPGAETLLFWDESANAAHHDGRITIPVNRAANLAQFTPAGHLVLQIPAATKLRAALTAALTEAAGTIDTEDYCGIDAPMRADDPDSPWGGCEHAVEPEPTISILYAETGVDGEPSLVLRRLPVHAWEGLIKVAMWVSRGRSFAFTPHDSPRVGKVYPDATARRALGALHEAQLLDTPEKETS